MPHGCRPWRHSRGLGRQRALRIHHPGEHRFERGSSATGFPPRAGRRPVSRAAERLLRPRLLQLGHRAFGDFRTPAPVCASDAAPRSPRLLPDARPLVSHRASLSCGLSPLASRRLVWTSRASLANGARPSTKTQRRTLRRNSPARSDTPADQERTAGVVPRVPDPRRALLRLAQVLYRLALIVPDFRSKPNGSLGGWCGWPSAVFIS
jgi:hypothetical protein